MIVNPRRALILAVVLLAAAVLLGLLVAIPATRLEVQDVDDVVRRFAVSIENRPTTVIAEAFAFVGGAWVNWSVRIVALVVLARRRQFLNFSAFALAVITSEVSVRVVKAAFDRARPPDGLIFTTTTSASFPSGHAIAAAVTALGLVLVLLPPGPARWKWEVGAVVFAFLMALSRVYLRMHWLSDVVAGGLVGAGLTLGWPALLQALRARHEPGAAAKPSAEAEDATPPASGDCPPRPTVGHGGHAPVSRTAWRPSPSDTTNGPTW